VHYLSTLENIIGSRESVPVQGMQVVLCSFLIFCSLSRFHWKNWNSICHHSIGSNCRILRLSQQLISVEAQARVSTRLRQYVCHQQRMKLKGTWASHSMTCRCLRWRRNFHPLLLGCKEGPERHADAVLASPRSLLRDSLR
jgi:hypothetical protein